MEIKIDFVIELLEKIEPDVYSMTQRLKSMKSEIDELDQRFFSRRM